MLSFLHCQGENMEMNKPVQFSSKIPPKQIPQSSQTANSVAVYTVLSILRKMKTELGFEAMLEYLEKYLLIIEQSNPPLKKAVEKALVIVRVEKIYQDAMKG